MKRILLGCFIIVMIVLLWWKNKSADARPAFTGSATTFIALFEADETKATTEFANKEIQLTGSIIQINIADTAIRVLLGDTSLQSAIDCHFMPSTNVKQLAVGNVITVKGTCQGRLLDVLLSPATIVAP